MQATIETRDEDTGVVFRWHGGAYIDVGHYGDAGASGIDGDDFHAYDVINVWNIGGSDGQPEWSDLEIQVEATAGQRTAPRRFRMVLEAFEARCEAYMHDLATEADDA